MKERSYTMAELKHRDLDGEDRRKAQQQIKQTIDVIRCDGSGCSKMSRSGWKYCDNCLMHQYREENKSKKELILPTHDNYNQIIDDSQ